jgi:HKD family nuclease
MAEYVDQPEGDTRLGDHLLAQLADGRWTEFRAAIAFVKRSGVKHLAQALRSFTARASAVIVVGVDHGGTSAEGLQDLFEAIGERGELYVFHNLNPSTFHPKVYYFRNDTAAMVIVGSSNLTEGGLFTNYEASVVLRLDLTNEVDAIFARNIEAALAIRTDPGTEGVLRLTDSSFIELVAAGFLPQERAVAFEDDSVNQQNVERLGGHTAPSLFHRMNVRRAPRIVARPRTVEPAPTSLLREPGLAFVMTLQQTDVGVGQSTAGTARRSPEIFIPLAARNFAPEFWGWPDAFEEDAAKPGKMDRRNVPMWIGTEVIAVTMMSWPDKHDFRLRSETLRSAGRIGDILRVERATANAGFDYHVQIVPVGAPQYYHYASLCVNTVRNSGRRWGYY